MNQRVLYLHIGFGKTGSSALQNYLLNNAESLRQEGIFYPVYRAGKIPDYQITSGNGPRLIEMINSTNLLNFLDKLKNHEYLLFSSESFQDLSERKLEYLRDILDKLEYRVRVICYVRDIYEGIYSSYLQRVKRSAEQRSFFEFVESGEYFSQFEALERFEKYFNNISLIHYDSHVEHGIHVPFLKRLGIAPNLMPEFSSKKVNRSLNVDELSMMILINKLIKSVAQEAGISSGLNKICMSISDYIIYKFPEKQTGILFDEKVLDYLSAKYSSKIDNLNNKYFDENLLKLIHTTNFEKYNPDAEKLLESYSDFIEGMIHAAMSQNYSEEKL